MQGLSRHGICRRRTDIVSVKFYEGNGTNIRKETTILFYFSTVSHRKKVSKIGGNHPVNRTLFRRALQPGQLVYQVSSTASSTVNTNGIT